MQLSKTLDQLLYRDSSCLTTGEIRIVMKRAATFSSEVNMECIGRREEQILTNERIRLLAPLPLRAILVKVFRNQSHQTI